MIKLGIVGFSDGNGHPYSWSAIFNGYNVEEMNKCGFPIIPYYLGKQKWPESMIEDAKVISIWTQDLSLSNKISKACKIARICYSVDELIEYSDAIIIARDDLFERYQIALKVLDSGKYLFLDKPVAVSLSQYQELLNHQKFQGQLFSCSSLRYSPTLHDFLNDTDLIKIECFSPKSWDKYGVHLIDPILTHLILDFNNLISTKVNKTDKLTNVELIESVSKVELKFCTSMTDQGGIRFVKYLKNGNSEILLWNDSFNSFKSTLKIFIDVILEKIKNDDTRLNREIVKIIEMGAHG